MRDPHYIIRCVLLSCAIVTYLFLYLKHILTTSIVIQRWICCVLSMLQTTQIELGPKDFMLLANYLGIQFTPQLFLTVSIMNNIMQTRAPNSHKCKPSLDKIQSQQPKGRQSSTDWIAPRISSLYSQCRKPHRSNSNQRIAYSS